ncbi:MAG TPA: M23 family metallopeptidase [Usitatibacter sp.]|jgi:murein DD-endopeptidase MepM/ murein hydrolase activator NlpD|nr:M23 family metallopeptidase [Usitatibacter sp.]
MSSSRTAFMVLLLSLLGVVCAMQAMHRPLAPSAPEVPAAPRLAVQQRAVDAGITRENVASADAMQELMRRRLLIPVAGVDRAHLRDTFDDLRAGVRRHEALDIMASRGTPVLAAGDGTIAKLTRHPLGGITIYENDPVSKYSYYYAHLDHYAAGLHVGEAVHRGEVIGYVGSTGNAPAWAPHLHFTILDLSKPGHWWGRPAVNPYPFLVEASR